MHTKMIFFFIMPKINIVSIQEGTNRYSNILKMCACLLTEKYIPFVSKCVCILFRNKLYSFDIEVLAHTSKAIGLIVCDCIEETQRERKGEFLALLWPHQSIVQFYRCWRRTLKYKISIVKMFPRAKFNNIQSTTIFVLFILIYMAKRKIMFLQRISLGLLFFFTRSSCVLLGRNDLDQRGIGLEIHVIQKIHLSTH